MDQVLEKFKEFHALIERQSCKKLKRIRTDNGAEKMNRTLLERVRCMLSDAKLPKHFWDEALYTTVHVINLTPTVILDGEMPDQIWFGKNASYDYLVSSFVRHLFMFQRMKDPNWIRRQDNVSLLVIVRMNLATGCMILLKRSLLEAVMCNSWKTKPLKILTRWRRLHPRKIII
uniref:Retrovirus-related Pol polyprotein from transposon TNT 1-94 n=1 Tax=Cajanus cajan TaxID=3821 RepID=A0A151QTI3_CAJCA|nr:Retrovirus-related Pol polyprotein from transposon TNT 1-94 [Cajanus cajan]